jgi:hypothetical protein
MCFIEIPFVYSVSHLLMLPEAISLRSKRELHEKKQIGRRRTLRRSGGRQS